MRLWPAVAAALLAFVLGYTAGRAQEGFKDAELASGDAAHAVGVETVTLTIVREGTPAPLPPIEHEPQPRDPIWPLQLDEWSLTLVLTRAGWPQELLSAVARVAWCESRWTPGIVGDHGASLGLFQIQPYAGGQHLWRLGELGYAEDPDLLLDPVINAEVALAIYQSSGWNPWSCARKVGLIWMPAVRPYSPAGIRVQDSFGLRLETE